MDAGTKTVAVRMTAPHVDIDFMKGTLHYRASVEVGTLTKPMMLGRACTIRLPDGATFGDVEALKEACATQLSRIKAGFSTDFIASQLTGVLSPDAQQALAEIREKAAKMA